jgi:hypothetical protein
VLLDSTGVSYLWTPDIIRFCLAIVDPPRLVRLAATTRFGSVAGDHEVTFSLAFWIVWSAQMLVVERQDPSGALAVTLSGRFTPRLTRHERLHM